MEDHASARVVHAEWLREGVLIKFADGKSALYPLSFLRSHLPWYEFDVPHE